MADILRKTSQAGNNTCTHPEGEIYYTRCKMNKAGKQIGGEDREIIGARSWRTLY